MIKIYINKLLIINLFIMRPDSKQGKVLPWLENIILTKTKILSLCLMAALNPLKKKPIDF